jgi:hypothetical protein
VEEVTLRLNRRTLCDSRQTISVSRLAAPRWDSLLFFKSTLQSKRTNVFDHISQSVQLLRYDCNLLSLALEDQFSAP